VGTSARFRRTALSLALVVTGCRGADPIPERLKARLASVFDVSNKEPTPDEVRAALARQLRRTSGSGSFPSQATVGDFYAKHGSHLIWSDAAGKPVPGAATLITALRRAGEHGLDPDAYATDRLESMEKERSAEGLADFDLLATTALLRYASDLATGRVHPDEVQSDWKTNPPDLDLGTLLDEGVQRNELEKLFESLPPPHPGYARLREGLSKLRAVEQAGGWATIPPGPKITKGSRGERVALLRRRLTDSATVPAAGDRYDATLAGLIRRFQSLHGIEPDGVVSERTLEELNVPVDQRIRQVELNLERWRWVPREFGDPHVLVNIPGFDLELAQGSDAPWRTRVVAGKAFTPTPVFSDRIVAIVVNPPWNVPESIAVNEYLPELRKNPSALARHGIKLLEGSGEKAREVDPARVKWESVDADHFPYRLRQDPGKDNPLGRLKFDLTNDFHIYLHDTPGGAAFDRSGRDLSHGCIRVQNALELADRIASNAAKDKIHEALEQEEERRVELDSKIPVHIFYWTAWADEAGELHFAPDVYGFDAPQRAALDRVAGKQSLDSR
jgi:murein L,D-transpeptidase YcbB/YkuD